MNKKSIIIYFSRADENYAVGNIKKGNTEVIAEYIQKEASADIFKVEPLIPYSASYDKCIEEAKVRTSTHNAPIKKEVPDIKSYDTIYIGSPIYWGGMPEELFTALKDLDLNGKTIKPFVTHEGSGMASVKVQLEKLFPNATVKEGLAIQGSKVNYAKDIVTKWINT